MFDIGFPELMLIAIVGLLVIGPERLPEALRTLGLWFGRMRRSFTSIKAEIEKEIGMDEVRRQLHNEAIMDEMKRIESEVRGSVDDAQASLDEGIRAADVNSIAPPPAADGSTADPASESIDEAQASLDEGIRGADVNSSAPPPPDADGATTDPPSESIAEAQASLDEGIRGADVNSASPPPPDADGATADSAGESIAEPKPKSSVEADLPGH
jgi:sec-independent protein translocase protein TatB